MESVATHSGLTEIAPVVLTAAGFGIVMERLRPPAIVGHIPAGVVPGSSVPVLTAWRLQEMTTDSREPVVAITRAVGAREPSKEADGA